MNVTINGVEYVTGKLDAFKQFHITRRLTPVMLALAGAAGAVASILTGQGAPNPADLAPMADAIAGMSDADAEYVLHACLAVCERRADGGGYQRVFVPGGGFMHAADNDMMVTLQLAIAVMRDNLGNFFSALPVAAPAASA